MSKWVDHAITQAPKIDAPKDSWWIQSDVQANRAAFSKRLLGDELTRMNLNPRFGGAKKIHDYSE